MAVGIRFELKFINLNILVKWIENAEKKMDKRVLSVFGVVVGLFLLGVIVYNLSDGGVLLAPALEKTISTEQRGVSGQPNPNSCEEGFTGNARCSIDGDYLEEEYQLHECGVEWRQTQCENGCQSGMCLGVTIATLDDEYFVGEDVELTDSSAGSPQEFQANNGNTETTQAEISEIGFYSNELETSYGWREFENRYGTEWIVKWSLISEIPMRISGGRIDSSIFGIDKVTKENIDGLAKSFIEANKELLKVNTNNLEISSIQGDELKFIKYHQTHLDIPVFGSYVILAVKNNGIVMFGSNYKTDIAVSTKPTISGDEARENAKGFFGNKNVNVQDKGLIIYPYGNKYVLTYQFDFPLIENPNSFEEDKPYIKPSVFVDANNGAVVDFIDNIEYYDLSGNVKGMIYPKMANEQQIEVPFRNEWVEAQNQQRITDENGHYVMGGLVGSVNVESGLKGPWANVSNMQQEEAQHSVNVNVPAIHDWNWKLDGDDLSYKEEESNSFYHTNVIHDYITKPSLGVDEMNLQMLVNVNHPYSCNAYFDGVSINFYQANENQCESSALSSGVIYHEYGHGINRKLVSVSWPYSGYTGNMNEGLADYWACTILDDACQGTLWYSGECVRRCDTNDRYPEDLHNEPHSGAQVVSAPLWELREIYGADIVDKWVVDALRTSPMTLSELLEGILMSDSETGIPGEAVHISDICQAFYDSHGIFNANCINYISNAVAMIDSPLYFRDNFYGDESVIEVLGTVYGTSEEPLTSYEIKYRRTTTNEWSDDGVVLTGGEVIDGLLGRINTSFMEEGPNTILLTVYYGNNQLSFISVDVFILGGDIKPGWPINTGHDVYTSPLIGDLDGNGFDDVIMGSFSKVYALKYDGAPVDTWGNVFGWTSFSKPALGDIDDDGEKEVILSNGNRVSAWNHDGSVLSGWPREVDSNVWDSSPTIGDIDNDGDLEVLVGSEEGKIYAWHHDGSLVDNFPITIPDYVDLPATASPSISDIDNDGDLEIFMGNNEGKIYAWHHDGTLVSGWPATIDFSPTIIEFTSSIAIADADNEGDLEIIVYSPNGKTLNLFDSSGNLGWSVNLGIYTHNPYHSRRASPAVADVDNDGDLEIFVGHWDDKMYGFHHDGDAVSGWPKDTNLLYSSAALFDVDNDGDLEIFVGDHVGVLHGWHHDGGVVSGFPKYTADRIGPSSPAIGDLENNGKPDIVVGSWDNNIYAWELDSALGGDNFGWPEMLFDNRNTGKFVKIKPKSQIQNFGNNDVSGLLVMKVQKKQTTSGGGVVWIDVETVYSGEQIIPAQNVLALDQIWNAVGWNAVEPYTHRVYVEFNVGGNVWSDSWEFGVVKKEILTEVQSWSIRKNYPYDTQNLVYYPNQLVIWRNHYSELPIWVAYTEWNLTLPSNAIIKKVYLDYTGTELSFADGNQGICDVATEIRPSLVQESDWLMLFGEAYGLCDGEYHDNQDFVSLGQNMIQLKQQAVDDIQESINNGRDWFAMGYGLKINNPEIMHEKAVLSVNNPSPELHVTYSLE